MRFPVIINVIMYVEAEHVQGRRSNFTSRTRESQEMVESDTPARLLKLRGSIWIPIRANSDISVGVCTYCIIVYTLNLIYSGSDKSVYIPNALITELCFRFYITWLQSYILSDGFQWSRDRSFVRRNDDWGRYTTPTAARVYRAVTLQLKGELVGRASTLKINTVSEQCLLIV